MSAGTHEGGTSTRATRGVLGAVGVLVGLYGAYLLLSRQDGAQQLSVVKWLVGSILLHDVAIAAFSLVVAVAAARLVPATWLRRPLAVGLVVLGTVSVVGFPMIGRFGAASDLPSLLNRHYTIGWLVVAVLVVLGVVAGALIARRHAGADRPAGATPVPRVE